MKTALVTGGSRGIGKAIAIKLAEKGYYVLVNFHSNKNAADEALNHIQSNGGNGELLQMDVSNRNDIKNILGGWIKTNPDKAIEVLVNNAGIKDDSLMLWMKDEQWDSVLQTNLDSFFFITRIVIENMVFNRYGRIINIVSLSGLKGLPGQVNYSAAKAGIIGATKALAQELGRSGITVNAVAPGFIQTSMTENMDEKNLKKLIPVNRFGTPEEVAHAVAFLVSPEAGYITSQVLSVNGGLF